MINKLTKLNLFLAAVIFALVPFHAIISIWLYSIFGHYTLTRLIEEYLLFVMLMVGVYLLFFGPKEQWKLFKSKLILLICSYFLIELVVGVFAYANKTVNMKALFYGLLLNSRYLLYFLLIYQAVFIYKLNKGSVKFNLNKLILYPSLVVVGFGILQIFFLPNNFLAHFGYSKETILPFQTVNNSTKYIRILSTLRGSNSLGAYLIFPITLITAQIFKKKNWKYYIPFLLLSLIVLYFSYSRSAVLGIALSIGLLIYQQSNHKFRRILEIGGASLVIVAALVFIFFRNNTYLQNIVFHTSKNSSIKVSSDQGHLNGIQTGLKNILSNPLGKGPGSAGQASLYNNHPAVISEDYFIQIGEEVGVIGLIIYLAIYFFIYRELLKIKTELSKISIAVLSGLLLVSLFWFTLSDETLSFMLFGILGYVISNNKSKIVEK